jgi:hypothetical protein
VIESESKTLRKCLNSSQIGETGLPSDRLLIIVHPSIYINIPNPLLVEEYLESLSNTSITLVTIIQNHTVRNKNNKRHTQSHQIYTMKTSILSAACLASLGAATDVLLPLYVYPSTGAWDAVYNAAAAYPDVTFRLIVDPDSGPGAGRE